MGYLRPTAIIVTASYRAGDDFKGSRWIEVAHEAAIDVFSEHGLEQLVGGVIDGVANSEQSFLVAWDGSKEGWEPSDKADEAREQFTAWLHAQAYDDGGSPLDWVEVQYGGDDREAIALDHGDAKRAAV